VGGKNNFEGKRRGVVQEWGGSGKEGGKNETITSKTKTKARVNGERWYSRSRSNSEEVNYRSAAN